MGNQEMDVLQFKKHKRFLHISLSNAKQRNCLSPKMMELMINILDKEVDQNISCVIITAQGEHFCAGADLVWMKRQKDCSLIENYKDSASLKNFFQKIYDVKVPVIAVVQGGSYGGGVGLVAVCDYVISHSKSLYCLSEVKLGLVPAVISPYVISKIGISWFGAMSSTAKTMNAVQSLEMGLIHEIGEDGLFSKSEEEIVNEVYERMKKLSPMALRENKKVIRNYTDKIICNKEVHFFNRTVITKLRASVEGQEGMNSVLEKRSPSWEKI